MNYSSAISGSCREFAFNDQICVEGLIGVPDDKRTGRLLQVRKGVGAFGSDLFFVRLSDGSIMSFHNVMIRHAGDRDFERNYYLSNGRTPPSIPEQPPHPEDSMEVPYTMAGGKWPETGFIIEHPKQPHDCKQSFGITVTRPQPINPS